MSGSAPLRHRLLGTLRRRLRDPEFQGMLALLAGVVGVGTVFYRIVEGWSWIDAFYFCVMTLATVGYNEVEPSGTLSKLFTIGFIVIGLGIMLGFVGVVTRNAAEGSRQLIEERHARHERS